MEITKGLNRYCFLNLAHFDFVQAEPSQVPQLDYTRGSGNLTRLSICDFYLQFLDAIATSSSSMNFDNIDNDKIIDQLKFGTPLTEREGELGPLSGLSWTNNEREWKSVSSFF